MTCKALNAEGEPCGQGTVGPSGFCIWHDPERSEEAAAARRRGLEQARLLAATEREKAPVAVEDLPEPLELTMPALLRRMAWVHQQVAAGKMTPAQSAELRGTIREMRSLMHVNEIEERLKEATARVKELSRQQGPRRAS